MEKQTNQQTKEDHKTKQKQNKRQTRTLAKKTGCFQVGQKP